MSVPGTTTPANSVIANSAAWSTGGMVAQGLARLVYTVLIGRSFGTSSLGHATAILALSVFVALLWPTAVGNAASRYIALALARRQDMRRLMRTMVWSWIGAALILGLVAIPIAWAWSHDRVLAVTAGWLTAAYAAYAFSRTAALGAGRARRVGLMDMATGALAILLLLLAIAARENSLVLIPISVGYSVFAAVCWPRAPHGETALPHGDAISFTIWNVIAGLATNGLLQLAMIATNVYADPIRVGIYAAAFTLATPASMVGQATSQIIVPAFAHHTSDGSLKDTSHRRLFLGFTVLCVVVFGLVAAVAGFVIPLIYPAQGTAAVPVFRYLLAGVFVFTIALVPSAFLLAAGRSREVAIASATGLVVGVIVILIMGPSFPLTAGSNGFIIGSLCSLGALVFTGSRRTKLSG